MRHREDPQATEDRLQLATCAIEPAVDESWTQVRRIGGAPRDGTLVVLPRTADRPIVSLPADPFVVPQHATLVLFVSTPLWVEVRFEDAAVFDVPTLRPVDTWVGPTTGPGEAAYANRTQCRQELDEIPLRPYRALTPVEVRNRSASPRPLERLRLAVPFLSLFSTDEGRLWTERIELSIEDDRTDSRIAAGAPAEARGAVLVSAPRLATPSGGLGRILANIL